ncbi:MAG: GTPase HflX [Candidatus Aminicenantes bacterium]|nr:GTPase HflX [Candidatus Aminicenantes bacterium]
MEKSIIVGVFEIDKKDFEISCILEELELLTSSAGGQVVKIFFQKKKTPDNKFLMGKGKAAEIKNYACARHIDLIVFYNHLSNVQQRNLEVFFDIKVIDRTRLILDIFATRARSLEGKLQVELAQLLYLLPRLTGKGILLSRLGGGIGTRGPGETKLEVDRRRIKKRISMINKRLSRVLKNRDIQRKNRDAFPVPVVSLVGYTSAGKSTLFKTMTGEEVFISKQLFSTLDPLLRRVGLNEIEKGYYFLLSDTVGFIREMPRELLKSFRATLEELVHADLIMHVVDISQNDYLNQKKEVEKVLAEMKVPDDRILTVFNKIDLMDAEMDHEMLSGRDISSAFVSAKEARGIINLKRLIFSKYFKDYQKYSITMPQNLMNLNSFKHWAIVTHHSEKRNMVHVEVLCSREKMIKFKEKFGGYVK